MTAEARVAVVTGGGRGLGRASALRLAEDGRYVVVADVGNFGAEVVAEVEALGQEARFVRTDVADRSSVAELVRETLSAFGRLDVLVAAAGVLGPEKSLLELADEEWDRILAVNLTGVFSCCRAVLPPMLERGWGRIVTFSSGARHGAPARHPYGASKGGVVALTKAIAKEFASSGILANCVEPGRSLTQMVIPRFSAEHLAHPPEVPIGRYAEPAEIAEVVAFLCSERCTYAAGSVYEVAGGAS
jgi:NAD(P)-dependent dehydrogenase (short-subunit alcohol dehydrogenase family)